MCLPTCVTKQSNASCSKCLTALVVHITYEETEELISEPLEKFLLLLFFFVIKRDFEDECPENMSHTHTHTQKYINNNNIMRIASLYGCKIWYHSRGNELS